MTERPEEPLWKFQQEKGDYRSCQTVTLENPKCFIPCSCTLLVMPLRGPQEHIKQAEFMITLMVFSIKHQCMCKKLGADLMWSLRITAFRPAINLRQLTVSVENSCIMLYELDQNTWQSHITKPVSAHVVKVISLPPQMRLYSATLDTIWSPNYLSGRSLCNF